MRRRVNFRFLAVLVAVVAVIGVGCHFLHGFQVRRSSADLKARAAEHAAKGEPKEAVRDLQRFLQLDPKDGDAQADLAIEFDKLAQNPKDRGRLFFMLEQALLLKPERDDARLLQVRVALEIGRYPEALLHVRKLLNKEVLAALDRARPATPLSDEDRQALGDEKPETVGDFVKAQQHARELLADDFAKNPKNGVHLAELELLLGRGLEGTGTRPALLLADEAYEAAGTDDPTLLDSYVRRADLLRQKLKEPPDQAAADQCMDRLVENNKGNAQAYVKRANYYLTGGSGAGRDKEGARREQLLKARQDLQDAYALAPDDAEVLLGSGRVARALAASEWWAWRELARAVEFADRGWERHPKDGHLYVLAAELRLQRGEPDQALRVLTRGAKELPGDLEINLLLADVLSGQGKSAAPQLAVLRKNNVDPALLAYIEGRSLANQGNWREACAALEVAYTGLETGRPDVARRAALLLGACYEHRRDPDRQLDAFRRAVPRDVNDPLWFRANEGVARTLLDMGKLDQAAETYEKLAPVAPRLRVEAARLWIRFYLTQPKDNQKWKRVEALVNQAEDPKAPDVVAVRAQMLAAQAGLKEDKKEKDALYDKAEAGIRDGINDMPKDAAKEQVLDLYLAWAGIAAVRGKDAETKPAKILAQAQEELGDSAALREARSRFALLPADTEPVALDKARANALEALAKLEEGTERFSEAEQVRLYTALAEAYTAASDFEQAKRCWDEVVKRTPTDLRLRLALFDLAMRLNDDAAMEAQAEALRKLEGAEGFWGRYAAVAQAVSKVERKASKQGDRKKLSDADSEALRDAQNKLKELAKDHKSWARIPVLQAQIETLTGHPEEALRYYRVAVDRGERRPAVIVEMVRLLTDQGHDPKEAADLFRQMSERALLNLGPLPIDVLARAHDINGAKELAQQAVNENPKDYRRYLALAQMCFALDPADKQREAENALKDALNPDKGGGQNVPETWLAYAVFLARKWAPDKRELDPDGLRNAKAVLEQAKTKVPEDQYPLEYARCYLLLAARDVDPAAPDSFLKQAEKLYAAALKAKPDDVATLRAAAEFDRHTRNHAAAEEKLKKVYDQLRDDPRADAKETKRAWRDLIFAILANPKDFAVRRKQLEDLGAFKAPAPTDAPESPDDKRVRALLEAIQGRREGREKAAHILEELDKDHLLTTTDQFTLANLYGSLGKTKEANDWMQKVLKKEPENPDYQAYFARSQLAQSAALSAQKKPEDAIAALGRADGAVKQLEKLQEKQKLDPKPYFIVELQARVLAAQARMDAAVPLLTSYADPKDTAPGTVLAIARLLESFGDKLPDKTAARDMYDKYVGRVDSNKKPEAALIQAAFLGRTGEADKALNNLGALLGGMEKPALPPETVIGVALEIALREQGDPTPPDKKKEHKDRIQGWITDALQRRITPQQKSRLLQAQANLYTLQVPAKAEKEELKERQAKLAAADKTFRECLALDKRDAVALNNLAWLLAIQVNRPGPEVKEAKEALTLIQQAIDISGPLRDLLDTRATVYLALGRNDEAVADLDELALDYPSANAYFHLAQAYWARNDPAKNDMESAKAMFQKAVVEYHLNKASLHPLDADKYPQMWIDLAPGAAGQP